MSISAHSSELEEGKEINESLFLLKRSSNYSMTNISVEADFSSSPQPQPSFKALPVFNQDGKFFTPAFILGLDQPKYIANEESYRIMHQRKLGEFLQEKSDLFVPKPTKGSSFCCVCRLSFDDYLTHVNVPQHQSLIRNSNFHSHISDLCLRFNAPIPQQESKKGRKTKGIGKQEKKEAKKRPSRSKAAVPKGVLVC